MPSAFAGSATTLFELLFRDGREAAMLGRPDGEVLAANAAAQALLGYREEQIQRLGRSGLMDLTDARLEGALAMRSAEGLVQGRMRMRCADGSAVELEISSTEFEAEGGRFTFILLRSAEALRLAEQAREQTEARLRFALAAADIGEWDMDLRTNVARRSLLHDRCFGYTEPVAEWGYDTFLAHVVPADRARVDAAFKAAMAGKGDYDTELRTTWRDGSTHWLWTKGSFSFDAAGAPVRVAGIVADVTQRRLAEMRLQLSEANLAASQRMAHLGSWELDLVKVEDLSEGALRWSSEVFRIWGHEPGGIEVTYDNFLAAVHPEDRSLIGEAVAAALRESRSYDLTHRILRPDGTERVVREQAEFQFDPGGRPYRMIGTVLDVTDTVQAERTLQRALERLNEAQRIGRIGDWEWTLGSAQGAGGISWSPAVFEIFGRDVRLGAPSRVDEVGALLEPESGRRLEQEVARVLETGEAREYELVVPLPGGERRFIQATAFARRDPGGRVSSLYGTVQDVTARKQAESAANRLAAIVEFSDDAILGEDPRGTITSWNRGAEKVFGYRAGEMIGAPITRLVPAGRWHEAEEILARVVGGASVEHFETQHLTRDGRLIDVSITASPIASVETGEVIGVAEVVRDITARKRGERRLRRLVESNLQGVFFWGAGGRVTEANDAFLEMTGYTREELAAGVVNWIAMTPPEHADLDRRALRELASGGVCTPYEKQLFCKDRTRLPVLFGAAAFEDDPGEGVCFVLDLTERKRLEQQFLRAQRMEGIGTLSAGIAHDLNNVLAPILMSVGVLRGRLPDAEDQQFLDSLEQSCQRGADLVKQVLWFSRGVEGERVTVNVLHLVRDLLKVVRETFPRSIDVKLTSSEPLTTVKGDATQIHQVLLNLCVNARDAMPSGGTLHVSVDNVVLGDTSEARSPRSRTGSYVKVAVEDTGHGVPPELYDRIFEPFFTTKELGKGTGLGLSTTEAIVKSHGGFLAVVSEAGRGARFEVYLPAEALPAQPRQERVSQPRPRGSGQLVLVVDDEEAVCKVAFRVLEKFGYRAVLASNGAEAVGVYALRHAEIAAVLTDFSMPVMNGAALINALRTIDPAVRVIGSSGLASAEAEVLRAGAQAFLPKPYDTGALLEVLQRLLTSPAPG